MLGITKCVIPMDKGGLQSIEEIQLKAVGHSKSNKVANEV